MNHPYESLAAVLIDAFVRGGITKPLMPEGRRDEIIAVLTRLMADPDLLESYGSILIAEGDRRGKDVVMRLLSHGGEDIPDSRIAAEGFSGLTDDQLADFATSPHALRAISAFLMDPETEPGMWFFDKVIEVEGGRPDAPEQDRRAREIREALRRAGIFSTGLFAMDASLPATLVEAFVRGGTSKPVVPEGRLDDVVATLSRLLINRERMARYIRDLETERRKHGVHERMLEHAPLDLPVEEIAFIGVGSLPDDQLAAIAIDPSSLWCLNEVLEELLKSSTISSTLWDALCRENQASSNSKDPVELPRHIALRLKVLEGNPALTDPSERDRMAREIYERIKGRERHDG